MQGFRVCCGDSVRMGGCCVIFLPYLCWLSFMEGLLDGPLPELRRGDVVYVDFRQRVA